MRRTLALVTITAVIGGFAAIAVPSAAPAESSAVKHLHFKYGPVHLDPGQNIIQISNSDIPKPTVPGWITGIAPNMTLTDGTVPPVDHLHLHHAVWLNLSRSDLSSPGLPQRFFATGEEKTHLTFPPGYGYRYDPSDNWRLNYMLHVLDDKAYNVYVTYDFDFIPATSPAASTITEAQPVWMDVQNGSIYPVFNVTAGSGTNGAYTYPTDANNPYGGGAPKNEYTVPFSGELIQTAGHLHPGGLHTDLYLTRGTKTAHLYESKAHYFEPAGPVSWDVAMTATTPKWNVHVKAGDTLSVTATYDTTHKWSWYEVMGIMIAWIVPDGGGTSAFTTGVDIPGKITHGHLPENDNHGGAADPNLSDPSKLPSGPRVSTINIGSFTYSPGDLDHASSVPTVKAGHTITFINQDAPASGYGTWHTITTCKLPCNLSTGIAYPVANAARELDSGQLGNDGQPTAGTTQWTTPADLTPGTYVYFCRVHPFMRGAFRVVP
jgi:plastocyanin